MIIYILKSAACLALLLCFYHLVLEREKMHKFNRFYLLGSVLFSFLAPAFVIYIEAIPYFFETTQNVQEFYPAEFTTTQVSIKEPFNYSLLFISIYILISCVFAVRFLSNLWKINQKIKLNEKINLAHATLVLVDDKILPHSFWKSIFINKEEYKNNKLEPELLTHELTHVTQKHTIDIILLELLQIIFWINPLFIFLKKAIQLNHEFLADNTVIKTHKNTIHYQHLLLNKAAWKNEYYLASNLNYSLTKKRLKMMTTQNSKTKVLLKKLAVIPLLAGFIFLFADRVEAQEKEKQEEIITIYEQEPLKHDIEHQNELYKEYFYKDSYQVSVDKNGKKVKKKYADLTKEEKRKTPAPPPFKIKKRVPSEKLIEDLKDNSKYAVWIDGKAVKNDVLKSYKNTDFSNHSLSFVHKNARTKHFPQKNQASLSTHNYFKKLNKDKNEDFINFLKEIYNIEEINESPNNVKPKISQNGEKINSIEDSPITTKKSSKQSVVNIQLNIKDINELMMKVNNPLDVYKRKNKYYEEDRTKQPHFVESNEERQNSLAFSFSELGSLYFKLSKEDKRKAKSPIHPHDPYMRLMKNNKVFHKLRNEITEEDQLLIPPPPVPNASKEETLKAEKAYENWKKRTGNDFMIPPPPPPKPDFVYTYNRFANEMIKNNRFKIADFDYLKSIYNKMSQEEKDKVKAPKYFLPPPPPRKKN